MSRGKIIGIILLVGLVLLLLVGYRSCRSGVEPHNLEDTGETTSTTGKRHWHVMLLQAGSGETQSA